MTCEDPKSNPGDATWDPPGFVILPGQVVSGRRHLKRSSCQIATCLCYSTCWGGGAATPLPCTWQVQGLWLKCRKGLQRDSVANPVATRGFRAQCTFGSASVVLPGTRRQCPPSGLVVARLSVSCGHVMPVCVPSRQSTLASYSGTARHMERGFIVIVPSLRA